MVHRLPALFSGVDDDPIAVVQLPAAGNVGGGSHQMAEQWGVFGGCLCLRGDVLFGDDQQVGRGLGINVGKTDTALVFVHTIRWDLSLDNFAEQTIGSH